MSLHPRKGLLRSERGGTLHQLPKPQIHALRKHPAAVPPVLKKPATRAATDDMPTLKGERSKELGDLFSPCKGIVLLHASLEGAVFSTSSCTQRGVMLAQMKMTRQVDGKTTTQVVLQITSPAEERALGPDARPMRLVNEILRLAVLPACDTHLGCVVVLLYLFSHFW